MKTFWTAVASGDLQQTRAWLKARPEDAAARREDGASALRVAQDHGHSQVVEYLLKHGAPVDVLDAAALGLRDGLFPQVKRDPALLESHSHDGFTPLHLAAFFGHGGLVSDLLKAGADVGAKSDNAMANTPLHAALAGRNAVASAGVLIRHGADVNAVAAGGVTPLHLAASRGDRVVSELLLRHGAASVAMDSGSLPADLARERGHPELARLLESS